MENKEIRRFWSGIDIVFLWLNALTGIPYIFAALATCCIIIGDIRSRQL